MSRFHFDDHRDSTTDAVSSLAPVVRKLAVPRPVADLMTVKEVAQVLWVCTATVYILVSTGRLEHVRVLNAIRIPRQAVEGLAGKNSRTHPLH